VQATFTARVVSAAELAATFQRFQASFDAEQHPIYHQGTEMLLESLLGGPEYQLELMLRGGRTVFHCFSSRYSDQRDALVFPAVVAPARRAALLAAAEGTAAALGLTEGVVHVELFDDPAAGAVVIEVNNRLSRGFLPQSFLHQVLSCSPSPPPLPPSPSRLPPPP
jgi:biotin carboxylase